MEGVEKFTKELQLAFMVGLQDEADLNKSERKVIKPRKKTVGSNSNKGKITPIKIEALCSDGKIADTSLTLAEEAGFNNPLPRQC